MIQTTWSHLLARVFVRPLIGTGVTPNHLTTLRLLTGLAACGALALGTADGRFWGGMLWLVSALLDRADGELARLGNMMSEAGHRYDYVVDTAVTALFFVAIGAGARDTWLGAWAPPLGLWTGAALWLSNRWSEELENRTDRVARAFSGRWGFDFDDLLYLLGPIAWLNWNAPVLVASAVGTTVAALIVLVRLRRLPA